MTIHAKIDPAADKRPSPAKAVRRHCVDCCGGNTAEPAHCPALACPLWPHRFGRKPTPADLAAVADTRLYPLELGQTGADAASRTALKSIPMRCLDCAGSRKAVKNCTMTDCDLHPYRHGKGNKKLSPEQRQRNVERLRQARWHESRREDDA